MYDEAWLLVHQLKTLILLTTGNRLSMDFSVFHICAGARGWPPHRDRGGDSTGAFRPDREHTPQYVTTWIALSDATTTNSCLHVVSRRHDPGYFGGDEPGVAPMSAILAHGGEAALQHVRALPCAAGSVVQFSHRLLHWGSAAEDADGPASRWRAAPEPPRIALSFASVDDSFEKPFMSRDVLPMPPVDARAALVGSLALLYTQHDPPPPFRRQIFWELVEANEAIFDPGFYGRIRRNVDAEDAGASQVDDGSYSLDALAAPSTKAVLNGPPAQKSVGGPAPMLSARTDAAADTGAFPMFTGPRLLAKLAQLARYRDEGRLTAEQYEKAKCDVKKATLIDPAHAPLSRAAFEE